MKRLKSSLVVLLALMLLISSLSGCSSGTSDNQQAPQKKFINIAAGGTAGVYFPLAGAIAEILNKNIEGANATAQTTGASVANVNLLAAGDVDIAFIQNDIAYYAVNGKEMFADNKIEGLKCLATLYPETCQIVTLQKTGIKSIEELKGKRVAVGAAGSGVEANARQILSAAGITYDDISVQYLSFAEAANSLKDGNVDAAFITAGHPTAAIQDIASQNDVVLLPISSTIADSLIKDYPFYTKVTIPANTYPNQTEEIQTLGVKAMLVVSDKMNEETGYNITKAIFTNLDKIKAAHSVGALISIESAKDGVSIPMHTGAEKYYNEK